MPSPSTGLDSTIGTGRAQKSYSELSRTRRPWRADMFPSLGCLILIIGLALAMDPPGFGQPPPAQKKVAAAGLSERNDLYGDPLPPGARARLGTIRLRHPGYVTAVALSRDRKMIASAAGGQTIFLWDASS